MATVELAGASEQRFVLRGVDWCTYQGIAAALGDRPVRLTYDRGNLELMTVSHRHERCSGLLGRLVETLTFELGQPLHSGGSTTFSKEDLDRGLEPDRCYWVESEAAVHGKDEIDLSIDPPPDLAIEVEISHSCLNRMGIYAATRVPEVWRFDGIALRVYLLQASGEYVESERSRLFPFLPLAEVAAFLQQREHLDDNSLVRVFQRWVREQIARRWSIAP